MPMDAPGSLQQQQYLDVLAFIFSKNGYPAGDTPMSKSTLATTPLLPYPHAVYPTPPAPVLAVSTGGKGVPASTDVTVTDAMMNGAEQDAADWLLPGRTHTNQRYSPLAQITTANVPALKPVAVVHTHMFDSFEMTPIVVHGVMYITTPTVEHVVKIAALDATTGKNLWTTSYHVGDMKLCCGPNNRGAAVAYGNVYVTTLDDKLLALDARTGKERWETKVADPSVGYSESMAPQIDRGLVIIGSAGGEWALRGFVAAYDAHTGAQKWRWYSTDPKTFAGDSWKKGGGTVWTTPALDQQQGLVIFGVGNPNPDVNGSTRAGDNLYTDSIVALDVRTGKLRWYYQEVKHDLWDYDATSNVVLFDVHAGGKTIPAAGQPGKVGWYFIVDRRNGKLIRKSQPFVLQSKDMFGKKHVLPGANGGSEWSPSAYSPRTRMAYVLGMDQMMDFTTATPGRNPGFIRVGSGFTSTKKPLIQAGRFSAIDVESGKIAWQYKAPKPLIGGAMVTAGDLVFTGEGDGTFEAFDARNGKRLWRYGLDAGVNAPPVSYEVGGKQYVAVAAGGNYQLNYGRGDQIVIFALK
jgi:glucose dehydrogenase